MSLYFEDFEPGARFPTYGRTITEGDLALFSTWCPKGTDITTLVRVEGHRWAIEDSFETTKNELGLDHNETRSWHGWHRHVSLVMLAFAMLAVIRHYANAASPPKTAPSVDQMVGPGNTAHRNKTRSAPNPSRSHHRMVSLAKSSSSQSPEIPS